MALVVNSSGTATLMLDLNAIRSDSERAMYATYNRAWAAITGWTAPENINSLLPPADDPFEEQKTAFKKIPPLLLVQYSGKWVVSRDGAIVDSDDNLQLLSRRFFDANGDVDVYIARVSPKAAYRRPAPRTRR